MGGTDQGSEWLEAMKLEAHVTMTPEAARDILEIEYEKISNSGIRMSNSGIQYLSSEKYNLPVPEYFYYLLKDNAKYSQDRHMMENLKAKNSYTDNWIWNKETNWLTRRLTCIPDAEDARGERFVKVDDKVLGM